MGGVETWLLGAKGLLGPVRILLGVYLFCVGFGVGGQLLLPTAGRLPVWTWVGLVLFSQGALSAGMKLLGLWLAVPGLFHWWSRKTDPQVVNGHYALAEIGSEKAAIERATRILALAIGVVGVVALVLL